MNDIPCPLAVAAERFPDEPALIDERGIMPYREYDLLVSSAAAALMHEGVRCGDRVAILAHNSSEYAVLLMALVRAGAVACPISMRLPADAVRDLIRQINAKFLVASTEGAKPDAESVGILELNTLLSGRGARSVTAGLVPLDQITTVMFTSGVTSRPKAVVHTFANHYYNALGSNRNISIGVGDRWLLSLPLFHVGGLAILFRAILGGGAVVIPHAGYDLPAAIRKYAVSHISLVAAQLHRLLEAASRSGLSLRSLKAVLLGGGAVPMRLIRQSLRLGLPVHSSYGLTEMASQVTATRVGDGIDSWANSGRPLDYREVKISPAGEILVRGSTLFAGYLAGESVDRPFDPDGWFATGDTGFFNPNGCLVVTGRIDNMFISGGENIHPEEIEARLCEIESIREAVVVPVEHRLYGSRPVAFVRCTDRSGVDENYIGNVLRASLPGFKVPDRILPWPDNLASSGIKSDRGRLRIIASELLNQ